jgi:hypothetical protein
MFNEAIPRFLEIGWLEEVADSSLTGSRQDADRTLIGDCHRTERNGTEENGIEGNRSFVTATDQISIWEAARGRAREIRRLLWPTRNQPLEERDRDMLLKVCFLALGTLTEDWLANAVEGTRQKAPRKPAAYLKTILAEQARKLGHDLNELLDEVVIPQRPQKAAAEATDG